MVRLTGIPVYYNVFSYTFFFYVQLSHDLSNGIILNTIIGQKNNVYNFTETAVYII